MRKHHGEVYTVKYLKVCLLVSQKVLCGEEVRTLRELEPNLPFPRLSRSGLPKVIPLADRRSMLSGNQFIIQY